MGYDALPIQANIPQDRMTVQEVVQQPMDVQENYVRMARYKNRSMDPEERRKQAYRRLYGNKGRKASNGKANQKEQFEYMEAEQSSQNQNFDTSG